MLILSALAIVGAFLFATMSSPAHEIIWSDNPDFASTMYVYARDDEEETRIETIFIADAYYLFLPSGMDSEHLQLYYEMPRGFETEVNGIEVKAGKTLNLDKFCEIDPKRDAYVLNCRSISRTNKDDLQESICYVMFSDHLRSAYFSSEDPEDEGEIWIDTDPSKTNRAKGKITLLAADTSRMETFPVAEWRMRGHTSTFINKKSYQMKLAGKQDLLGSGNARKKYSFVANGFDWTLLHNQVTYDFAKEIGLDAPECEQVDLYYDAKYIGTYLLCETYESPLGDGAYFMEADPINGDFDLAGSSFEYVDPEEPSPEEESMIQNLVVNLYEHRGQDLTELMDVDSYTKLYMIQEFSKNPDAFKASTYVSLSKTDQKFYFGPVWDFDISYGIVGTENLEQGAEDYYPLLDTEEFLPSLGQNLSVKNDMEKIYESEWKGAYDTLLSDRKDISGGLKSLTMYNEAVAASAKMNDIRWVGLHVSLLGEKEFASREEAMSYFEEYLRERESYMQSLAYGEE
ncbi:MAG: CotH kinase family protein [Lachnospiraceae bacterium]|nr:CotH kinase family protein [Lachnospiraceae bacterium]